MNTRQERPPQTEIELLPGEDLTYNRMKQFYQKADASGAVHAKDAIRCGAALIEEREFLRSCNDNDFQHGTRVSHVEPDSDFAHAHRLFHGGNTPSEATLASRMSDARIPPKRGYRWMAAAENIFSRVLRRPPGGPIPSQLEHLGKLVSLSEALALTDDQSDSPALGFQRAVFAVLEKHSLNDAIAGAFDTEPSDLAARRAINGATLGGAGNLFSSDRKDYPDFTLRKLEHLNTFFRHWNSMGSKQQSEIMDAIDAAILGLEYNLRGRFPPEVERRMMPSKFFPWPVEVCERAAKALKVRLNKK